MNIKVKLLILLLFFSHLASSNTLELTEDLLIKTINKAPPSILEMQVREKSLEYKKRVFLDNFQTNLNLEGGYQNSKEKAFSPAIPITTYASSIKASLSKNFKEGLALKTYLFTERFTNSYVYGASKSGIGIDLGVDLYKNLFGSLTKKSLLKLDIQKDIGKINYNISVQKFSNNIRKIFWALVANQKALHVSKKLLRGASQLEKDSKKRFKNKIADADAVLRNQTLVSSRKSHLLLLKYKEETLLEELKKLLPHLAKEETIIKNFNIDKISKKALSCLRVIASQKTVPLEFTKHDEIIKLLDDEIEFDQKISDSYSKMDIKFNSSLKKSGSKVNGRSESFDDFKDDGRISYELGLAIAIPLGSNKKTTQSLDQLLIKKRYFANKSKILGKLTAVHTQVNRSIILLNRAIKNQIITTELLRKTLKISKKKYNQARISLQDTINDENKYFASKLNEIETKLTIIQVLLDYLSVFTKTPCDLNIQLDIK